MIKKDIQLNVNGITISNPKEIANEFNVYFSNHATENNKNRIIPYTNNYKFDYSMFYILFQKMSSRAT